MNQSIYDIANQLQTQKEESDVIYKCFMSRDTTLLDSMLKEMSEIVASKQPGLSERFHRLTQRTLQDNNRIAKHGYLLFGLFMLPQYAQSLITPTPRVNPVKFELFYRLELPKLCTNLQNGIYTSLQEFVETARTTYIIL